ncbi:DUF5999 family protein [Streptomyces fenghuangensis]|uniref:DUF5999 family protein n=1 Tax=Streptomyces sp. ICN903 TaxID=2964654 RepID=UPI001EDA536A|nr:DUF5999 family protein [Streptomyces sp. ICN903]MCG3038997.1 DUF5999 family protein [Streptomyces sp. ICN903]
MCRHQPPCPTAGAADRGAAHIAVCHPEQEWSLLCNGVLVFGDTGELLPDGRIVAPRRPPVPESMTTCSASATAPHTIGGVV